MNETATKLTSKQIREARLSLPGSSTQIREVLLWNRDNGAVLALCQDDIGTYSDGTFNDSDLVCTWGDPSDPSYLSVEVVLGYRARHILEGGAKVHA